MPVSKPFIVTAPDINPPGDREWWFYDREVGPKMTVAVAAPVFFAWTSRSLNNKLNLIMDEYDIPKDTPHKIPGRQFALYDIERISRIFLNRGMLEYRRYYGANQIMLWMGRNYDLI